MAGYQGWFNSPTDGADRGWYHYRGKKDSNLVLRISIFGPTSAHIKRPMTAAEILPSSTGPVCISYADNRSNGIHPS
ncbi:hypothetical protein [Sphingobacterium multivorum]|uniref:hypothetical protein n=1 Tax=Sphingobacterium multivorum TaxID=28454 RepID=UPI0031BA6CF1